MTKAYGRFLSALFCGFLGGVLALSLLLPDRARSEVENRTLQQRPELTLSAVLDGSYMKKVESYVADQFPGRDGWTEVKSRCEQAVGKTEFGGVYLCGDTLISQVQTPDADLVSRNLRYVKTLSEKTKLPVYLGLIPSAAEIWRNKLPVGAESWDQIAFLNRAAAETGIPQVDFLSALQRHEDEPVFYRTDHHWTTLGAYYGYTAVLSALGRENEALTRDRFNPSVVSDSFQGTLYSTSGVHWLAPDSIEYWAAEDGLTVTSWRTGAPQAASLYDRSYLQKKDQYSSFLGGNQPLCIIRNAKCPEGGKLLVVRDSYADSLAPFLAQNFSEVHLLDLRYYRASVARYAADNGIDQILVLYSVPNFVTDQNLVFLEQ